MEYPNKITMPSDDTELELVCINKVRDGVVEGTKTPKFKTLGATYVYTKAYYNLGKEMYFNNEDFGNNIRKGIIVVPK